MLIKCFPELIPIWANHTQQAWSYLDKTGAEQAPLPRLIVVEPYLPSREEGWALVESLKNNPFYKAIPVISLSHSTSQPDIDRAYESGCCSYIIKPTSTHQWYTVFYTFRRYWWEVTTLPPPARGR